MLERRQLSCVSFRIAEDRIERTIVCCADQEVRRPRANPWSRPGLTCHQNVVRCRYTEVVEDVVDRQVVPGDELKVGLHRRSLDCVPLTGSAGHVRFAVDEANGPVAGCHKVRRPSREAVATAERSTNRLIDNTLAPRVDLPATATKRVRDASLQGVAKALSLIPVRHESSMTQQSHRSRRPYLQWPDTPGHAWTLMDTDGQQ